MSQNLDVEMSQEDDSHQEEKGEEEEAAKMELNSHEVRKAIRETREEMQGI